MGTAIKHPVPDWVKLSFAIFDIWTFWRSWSLSILLFACFHWNVIRLLFCSRHWQSDRFLNRCRKLYHCRQLNQDISKLFSLADQSHVLHIAFYWLNQHSLTTFVLAITVFPLLKNNPAIMTVNFITRMLFCDIYWLNSLSAWLHVYYCSNMWCVMYAN